MTNDFQQPCNLVYEFMRNQEYCYRDSEDNVMNTSQF